MKSTRTTLSGRGNSEADATSNRKGTGSKKRYRGVFNLGGQVIVRRTCAYSEEQAKNFMIRRIAAEKRLSGTGGLFSVFNGTKDNYVIEPEAP